MARIVKLILQEYPPKEEISQTKTCIGCLSKNVRFVDLASCKHANVFEYILEFKLDLKQNVICHTCHNTLKKIESFRIQMIESLAVLQNESKVQTNDGKKATLRFSNIEMYSISNNQASLEIKTTNLNPPTETPPEIKEAYDSSNSEHIPLEQTKKKKTLKRNVSVLKKQVYEGKIRIVVLTMEEMLEERRIHSKQPSYLRLPFKCELCYTAFDHEVNLKNHFETRHNKKTGNYECKICKSNLSSKLSYEEHTKRHFRRYECIECGKRSNNVYPLLKHYIDYHGKIEIQLSCKFCEFTTEYRRFRYHMEKHRKGKLECKLCKKTFATTTCLKRHMLTLHGSQPSRLYGCDRCDKQYRTKTGLSAHAASHTGSHAPAPAAYCTLCCTHFRTKHGLQHHLRTHSRHVLDADKTFICKECDAKFLTNKALQEHVDWVHLNETKYECDTCSKVLKTKNSLKKHLQYVHEKKRPPRNKICDHCGRGFTTLAILRSHIRTHTGERPHRCEVCGATFAHNSALYTHIKLLHRKK